MDLTHSPYLSFFKKHFRVFGLGVLSLFFTNLFDCLYPLAIKALIDKVEAGLSGQALIPEVTVFLAMMAAVMLFRFSWRLHFGHFQNTVGHELRSLVFEKLTTMGASFFQKNPVGELMSLITNDINSFRMALGGGVLMLLDAAFLIIMIVPLMMYLSVSWTWKTLLVLPLLPFLIRRIEHLIHERYKLQQERFAELSAVAQERVSGIRVIKSYAQEPAQSAHFNRYSERFRNACNQSARVESLFQPCMEFAVAVGAVILLAVCSQDVITGAMSLGGLYAFQRYIHKMIWPMTAIGLGVTMVQQGRASIERVAKLLDTPTDIPDTGTVTIDEFQDLELRHLTFTYPGASEPALVDVSLHLSRHQTLGLLGMVGSGKSTLVQLLGRLYPVERGMIFINGHDINDIRLQSLRQIFAFVPQDAFLFSETIADNLQLGLETPLAMEHLQQIAQTVHIDDEIHLLPDQYRSYLGERGVNLSGGQKQRLTIARALSRKAEVIVLDDSLSAVDAQTEKSIMSHLNDTAHGRQTKILISHRLRPVAGADSILVLNRGHVEALGSAAELAHISPTFQAIAALQGENSAEPSIAPYGHAQ